ncbi:MAG: hypothetical protein AAGI51_07870 [Pseudomonadota bacterium]
MTTPVSVRLTADDIAYLSSMEVANASTPSEKIRALLRSEKRRRQGGRDVAETSAHVRELAWPAQGRIAQAEAELGRRSDFLMKLYERLPRFLGLALAGPADDRSAAGALGAFEGELLDETIGLMVETLELALTTDNRCVDPRAVEKRLDTTLELLELLKFTRERRKGED